MPEPLFVDTGYVIALLARDDAHHDVAVARRRKVAEDKTPLVTSSAILFELADAFHRAGQWSRARPVVEGMQTHPSVAVAHVDPDLLARAFALRNARADKDWGLTDCSGFVVMQDRGIRRALSCDRHFEQAGFRALLIEG